MVRRIDAATTTLIVVNFANGDMVGHTGVLDAAVQASRHVDVCVGRILDAVAAAGGVAIVTADHGNCEQMIDPRRRPPHRPHDLPGAALDRPARAWRCARAARSATSRPPCAA